MSQPKNQTYVLKPYNLRTKFEGLICVALTDKEDGGGIKGIPGFKYYTGIDKPLGDDLFNNTSGTIIQMFFTLCLAKHPTIDEVLKSDSATAYTLDISRLVKDKVLAGIKILDLGCGEFPTYARCVRALGANTYTADYKEIWDPPANKKTAEKENHIIVDFNSDDAIPILLERIGGNFDLVTTSICVPTPLGPRKLKEPSKERKEEIALALLKLGGTYYDSEQYSEKMKLVKEDF